MWTIKYAPKTLTEFVGNKTAIEEILAWLKNWKNEKQKILLIHGKPGTGKTTAIELIAKEFGLHLVATNASDLRSANEIAAEFGHSLQQQSLFHKGKLVLFDEADGLSAGDRGGASEILKISKASKYPIVLIANDAYHPKLKALRQAAKLVDFRGVHPATIEKALAGILRAEKIEFEERALKTIVSMAGGDLKAAINDIEATATGAKKLTAEAVKNLGYRDSTKTVYDSLKIIFKTMTAQHADEAARDIDIEAGEMLQWIRENLPLEYTNADDLARGYDAVSRADIFNGRIIRQQYWDYLGYVKQIAATGVALAKKEKYMKFVMYRYPTRIAMMGRLKAKRAERDFIAGKLGAHLHCSRHEALDYLPLLGIAEKKQRKEYEEFAEKAGLFREEEE